MSLLSDVQIANLALDAAGTRSTIASLQENSKEARACSRQYGPALAAVLQAAHWNFARKQSSLSLLKDGTQGDAVPVPWLYEYAYPSDCLQARYVMPLLQSNPGTAPGASSVPYAMGQPVRFIVSSDDDSQGNPIKVILCNQPTAILVYTRLVTNTGLFDDTFTQALAFYVAHRISIPLSGDKALAKSNFEIAERLTTEARASNGNEGLTVIDQVPDWVAVRGYASDWAYPPGSFWTVQPQALTMVT